MTGIERLVDIVNDGPYSGGMIHISVQKLREICEQIEREVDDINPKPSDSWEKWRKDFIKRPCVYCRDILGVDFDNDKELNKAFDAQAHDMERRAKALAERDAKRKALADKGER